MFESAVIEHHWRHEKSVEESSVDMYPAVVSTRVVGDIGQALQERADVLTDPVGQARTRISANDTTAAHAVASVCVFVDGHREVVGVAEGMREDS